MRSAGGAGYTAVMAGGAGRAGGTREDPHGTDRTEATSVAVGKVGATAGGAKQPWRLARQLAVL